MRHSSTQLLFVADARLETSFRASFSELNFDAALQFCRQIGCDLKKAAHGNSKIGERVTNAQGKKREMQRQQARAKEEEGKRKLLACGRSL